MPLEHARRLLPSLVLAASCLAVAGEATPPLKPDPRAPAEFAVTDRVLRSAAQVPPLGANGWGRCGAIEWAANNFVHNPGNEPIHWQNLHRAIRVGPNWFEIDGGGVSWYDLWASGFLSGADVRIYRLADKEGKGLPPKDGYLDLSLADHVKFLGRAKVIPAGSPGFPDGGWVVSAYGDVFPNAWIRHGNTSVTDFSAVENGRTYWYTVVAVDKDNQESDVASEASATPQAGLGTPPRIVIANEDKVPLLLPGKAFDFAPPAVFGGQPPFAWQAVDAQGKPAPLPDGLKLDPTTGRLTGTPAGVLENVRLWLRVTDARGRHDTRAYVLNPKGWDEAPAPKSKARPPAKKGNAAEKPEPPTDVKATAGDGFVTITWKPSPAPGVVAYRLKRATAPLAKQEKRVYLAEGAPALEPLDYVVVEKKFDPFDMRAVHPRVRGIGNPAHSPAWHWNADLSRVSLSLVPHPKPVPAAMRDAGEACLQVRAPEGEHSISQTVFIGTDMGGESVWYGQLEPGCKYRLEVWLRQQGLANGGAVAFSYGKGYPEIKHAFAVGDEWKLFTFDFVGPERPAKLWHFGHTFTFSGPGTLWLDNCRIFRTDIPGALEKPYVPHPVVLDELLASQPAAGRKGAHRIWFLDRDATMASILSWHATSQVRPDWRTAVSGTMAMTLPMALEFDRCTGPDAASRMRPWLVLQHLCHDEADWLALVEYLAAPYDPKADTPEAKPWAFRRFQQRGLGTPWTDEFAEIIVEFGNETWHNGVFDDWLGFRTRNWVHAGGPEYGLFCRYLIENMKKSPHWKPQGLDKKIRFCLGANYDGRIDKDGQVRGYGEEAMQTCPHADILGHANYVGPKWETGDKSSGVFDDHGVQETLLGFLTGVRAGQERMRDAREQLARTHHPYDIAAYEGGPSGYALPGRDNAAQREANENYGKSLAMAVACADAWLGSYELGWTDQCFLGYGQGNYWNSHTWFTNGFRPCPGWQLLAMRNRHASGDLVAVETRAVPALERRTGRATATYPLLGAYAMRDGGRWSVFVVSRKLDGAHDGADFGDGYTPVTLRLPFAKAAKITVHKLTGDPRANNRQKLNIAPQSQEVPATALKEGVLAINAETGGGQGGMPPGSIFLYVIEGAK
ncbi:MAG TPA: Ig domain-containing protein [Planctomycetota bacterium]|nr:Ig domain-containing protein [Planctomycetota bacterium]HRT92985.1 Ig domain-containing protein [Planctomycetota bacterium]